MGLKRPDEEIARHGIERRHHKDHKAAALRMRASKSWVPRGDEPLCAGEEVLSYFRMQKGAKSKAVQKAVQWPLKRPKPSKTL